jgi:prevent-host-death family protein
LTDSRLQTIFWTDYLASLEHPMARSTWSVQDAKNNFSAVVDAAQQQPQTVTKHGKPAVVVVDAAEYERLRSVERAQAPSFVEALLAMPQDEGGVADVDIPRAQVGPRPLDL